MTTRKKEYCNTELDSADDQKKKLERTLSDEEAAVSNANDGIAALTDELKALAASIQDLDKNVQEATEQRKQENQDYTELMALDTQAKELLGIAKNRLNKFYNPKLYVPPPKKELTREERISENFGVSTGALTTLPPAMVQNDAKPAPPPETFE